MRKKGTSEQLAIVRNRGLALLAKGKKPKEVAEILNVTTRCVCRWRQANKQPKRKKKTASLGRPRKLAEKQIKKLEKALDAGAYAYGYSGDYWTLDTLRSHTNYLAIVQSTLPSERSLVHVGSNGLEQSTSTASALT